MINPNIEYRNSEQFSNDRNSNDRNCFGNSNIRKFGFVSDFGFRISNLKYICDHLRSKSFSLVLGSSIAIFFLIFCGLTGAENPQDFELPIPPQSKFVGSRNFVFGGRDLQAFAYESKAEKAEIGDFYRNFFSELGFSLLSDTKLYHTPTQQIRFKKDTQVIDVVMAPKPEGTSIAVARYTQLPGTADLEKTLPSLKDSFMGLPKEDTKGEDLNVIPRPANSVRWASLIQSGQAMLTYAVPLNVTQTAQFYKTNMPYQAWELQDETPASQLINDYTRLSGKRNLGLPSPIQGVDLNRIALESYILNFKGRYGQARITVMPNFIDKKSGSVVHILYNQQKSP